MAYIAPNTTIVLCKGVPLDNTYGDTLYWSSLASQQSYFASMAVYTFTQQSYQRVGKGKMRVEKCADDLYGCNYLYFQNTSFGTKYFYAFITGIEYVNNITSEITYEIDVMQTYHFSYTCGYCFVEREHVSDDTIGANVIEEPINFGAIKCVDIDGSGLMEEYNAILAVASTGLSDLICYYGKMPAGLSFNSYPAESVNDLRDMWEYIDTLTADNKEDNIVTIWMQPSEFSTLSQDVDDNTHTLDVEMPTDIDGYVPRNNKLFCYPYNFLSVDAGGDTATYRYEWWSDAYTNTGHFYFLLYGNPIPNPEIICIPIAYNRGNSASNYTEALVLKDFPLVSWSSDSYKAWIANGGYTSNFISMTGSAAMIGIGAATGNPAMAASGAVGAAQAVNTAAFQATKGATSHGTQSNEALVSLRQKDFYFKRMQIQADYAEMLDDYFERYGYQVNKVKQPNRNSRSKWNYVKTQGMIVLSENVPADDVSKIESIYDAGITFWHSPSYVGRYTGTNSIV